MKREIIKIQEGNDTQLSIRALLPDGKTQVPIDDLEGFKVEDVKFTINGHEVDVPYYYVDNGLLVVQIDSDLALGKYGIHVKGKIVTQKPLTLKPDVDCNFYEVFEIVPYSDNVRYDNYYTDIFIVGLPDSTYEQLRKELEEKITYYQHLIDELDRGEVATKSDLGLAPGETVAGLIKAGGGGGGGLTPEQWAQIAKEETSQTINGNTKPILVDIWIKLRFTTESVPCVVVELIDGYYKIKAGENEYYVAEDVMVGGVVFGKLPVEGELPEITTYRVSDVKYSSLARNTDLDGINTKLDTIIANTSLTAAQADEDWQNVKPV